MNITTRVHRNVHEKAYLFFENVCRTKRAQLKKTRRCLLHKAFIVVREMNILQHAGNPATLGLISALRVDKFPHDTVPAILFANSSFPLDHLCMWSGSRQYRVSHAEQILQIC